MKQISTGTGLVVLSGTILASVFLSSPRTATTAFASAQQAQSAERSVSGNRGSNAAMVADCQLTESLQWFSSTPKEIQGCNLACLRGITVANGEMDIGCDINNDGEFEYLKAQPMDQSESLFLSTMETVGGVAISKLVVVYRVNNQSINDYRSSVGLSAGDFWWQIRGLRDCDNDGDLDIVIGSGMVIDISYMYFENTGFQHTAPLEGDLNHDGHVDNTDVGLVLLNFDA